MSADSLSTAQKDVASIIRLMICSLVDHPEQVKLEVQDMPDEILLRFEIPREIMGQVIGKQGRTARAIRTIMDANGIRVKRRFALDLIVPGDGNLQLKPSKGNLTSPV